MDELATGLSVDLWWRDASTASPGAFTRETMFDDGTHNDGASGDGVYASVLPNMLDGTVVVCLGQFPIKQYSGKLDLV